MTFTKIAVALLSAFLLMAMPVLTGCNNSSNANQRQDEQPAVHRIYLDRSDSSALLKNGKYAESAASAAAKHLKKVVKLGDTVEVWAIGSANVDNSIPIFRVTTGAARRVTPLAEAVRSYIANLPKKSWPKETTQLFRSLNSIPSNCHGRDTYMLVTDGVATDSGVDISQVMDHGAKFPAARFSTFQRCQFWVIGVGVVADDQNALTEDQQDNLVAAYKEYLVSAGVQSPEVQKGF